MAAIELDSQNIMSGPQMRIIQILSSIEAEASGPSYSVPRLAKAISKAGECSELFSIGEPSTQELENVIHRRFSNPLSRVWPLSKLGISPTMLNALKQYTDERCVFHTHGLWMMPNVYPAKISRRHNIPLVLSPRGMLSSVALKYSATVKRIFWIAAQREALNAVSLFHATSDQEYESIRSFGLDQPVAIVPNGIDIPDPGECRRIDHRGSPIRTVLFLGRLHPIKRVDLLIEAWSRIEAEFSGWELKICGPGEATHTELLRQQAKALGLQRCSFGPALYGEEKTDAFRNASIYVLPSDSENFAMTVAESLSTGTPVIATKGAPWSGLKANRCGWWIDHGAEPLAAALRSAMILPPHTLMEMGSRGRDWMKRDFSWDSVGREMISAYEWIRNGGAKPSFIQS